MNKSAVEFLVKELNEKAIFGGTIDRIVMNNIIEQAKEIEKQQQGYSEEELKSAFKIGFKMENGKRTETFYSKEEPKQELTTVNGSYGCTIPIKEPKQETLEEFAERLREEINYGASQSDIIDNLNKWQKEQDKNKYSLDDLKEAFAMGRTNATIKDFNTKFKNK